MRTKRTLRRGFTLIEMLVAMALTMFVMIILSQAFATALETFSGLKAIGDLQGSLRVATAAFQADLTADHFEGARRVSDQNIVSERPREGYFFVRQASAKNSTTAYLSEGFDADVLESTRSYDQVVAFTVRLRGNAREKFMMSRDIPTWPPSPPNPLPQRWSPLSKWSTNFFNQDRDGLFNPGGPPFWATSKPLQDPNTGNMLPDTYSSQWAEVAYFLLLTGTTDDPTNPGVGTGNPLFGLYRAQYLLVPKNDLANQLDSTKPAGDDTIQTTQNTFLTNNYYYAGISCFPNNVTGQLVFNSPADLADATVTAQIPNGGTTVRTAGMDRRVLANFGVDPGVTLPLQAINFPQGTVPGAPPRSSTLVVRNVVSFNIQVMYPNSGFSDVARLPIPGVGAPNIYIHDTTMATGRILALKITIRVFDPNTRLTRQMSVVQEI
jgi:Prokaryotic N-terminal methylation motif